MKKPDAKNPVKNQAPAMAPIPDPFAPAAKPDAPIEQTTPENKGATLIRKLSVKTIVGKIDPKKLTGEFAPLYRLAGVATGYESGEGAYGAWECLTGEFAAIVAETGETFAGNKAFVPSGEGDGIIAAAAHAMRQDAKAKVKFAVDVMARQVMRGDEMGYEYQVVPLIKINVKNEALDMLANLAAK